MGYISSTGTSSSKVATHQLPLMMAGLIIRAGAGPRANTAILKAGLRLPVNSLFSVSNGCRAALLDRYPIVRDKGHDNCVRDHFITLSLQSTGAIERQAFLAQGSAHGIILVVGTI